MRTMVSDSQDVYRVVVRERQRKKNPDYVQGKPGQRYWMLIDETVDSVYGPYNNLGSAKGILTRETVDTWNEGALKWGVVEGWIEKADTTWTKVDLGA